MADRVDLSTFKLMFIYSLLCRGGFHFLYRDLSLSYDSFIENGVPKDQF